MEQLLVIDQIYSYSLPIRNNEQWLRLNLHANFHLARKESKITNKNKIIRNN